MDKIIKKYDKLATDKMVKLKKVLSPVLVKELDTCRNLFTDIDDMDSLLNEHMAKVLPGGTITRIKNVSFRKRFYS